MLMSASPAPPPATSGGASAPKTRAGVPQGGPPLQNRGPPRVPGRPHQCLGSLGTCVSTACTSRAVPAVWASHDWLVQHLPEALAVTAHRNDRGASRCALLSFLVFSNIAIFLLPCSLFYLYTADGTNMGSFGDKEFGQFGRWRQKDLIVATGLVKNTSCI